MANVARVATGEALVKALEKSGLLAADQLAQARAAAATTTDPKALARQLIKSGLITLWQANQLLHGYYLLVVGKYKLLDQLASGAGGRVYLAEHMQIQRRHALKILARRHAARPEVLKRFLDDAQRLCALDHRNLSHIYDVNQDGDKYFLVMEYVEGQSLQKLVEKSGPLAPALAVLYALQAAEGLAHAHGHGIVHGDLQPASLLVDASGTVKITGIGQARLLSPPAADNADETTEAAALAAAVYRAPELRSGGTAVDARCDVYSLGSVLSFLLAGKPAADAADARQLLEKTDVPAELVQLCVSLMADDPGQRPEAMTDVVSSLAALEVAQATPAVEPAPIQATTPKRAKKPLVAKAVEPPAAETVSPPTESQEIPAFSLKGTRPRRGAMPAAKPAAAAAAATSERAPTPGKRSRLPLIIGGAVGGGVLVLGGIVLAVVLAMNWLQGAPETVVADAQTAQKKAAKPTPPAANPESNPETNPETSPVASPAPTATATSTAAPAVNPLTPPTATIPAAVPAPVTQLPEAPPAPMPGATVPVAAAEQPATEKPAAEKPEAAAPPAAPFVGFAKAVSLPKLVPSPTDPPGEPLAPLVLGPCAVDDKAIVSVQLKGGEWAIRGGRQKFELAAADDGTALRDWEISLTGGNTAKAVVASLSAKEGELTFQWTPEAKGQQNAALLCNCGLKLSAGPDQHEMAFREPIISEPLAVELDKPITVKWQLDLLPDPKHLYVTVARLDGDFTFHKFDKSEKIEASDDSTTIWTGSTDDAMPLGIRLSTTANVRGVEVKSSPLLKMANMQKPKPYQKQDINSIKSGLVRQRTSLTQQINLLKGDNDIVKKQKSAAGGRLEQLNAMVDQLDELTSTIDGLDGKAKIHFRVFYDAGDGPIDLLVTEETPPEDAGEKPAEEDAPAQPATKEPADAKKPAQDEA
jgi:serine/threonine-protein kinase